MYESGNEQAAPSKPYSSSCEMSHHKAAVTPPPGTYVYMAPEMIRHEMYDQKADVFSWGVLLVECLRQQPPYEEQYLGPVDVRLMFRFRFMFRVVFILLHASEMLAGFWASRCASARHWRRPGALGQVHTDERGGAAHALGLGLGLHLEQDTG